MKMNNEIDFSQDSQVLDSYNTADVARYLETLDDSSSLAENGATAGPFSVFRLNSSDCSSLNESYEFEMPLLNLPSSHPVKCSFPEFWQDVDNEETMTIRPNESKTGQPLISFNIQSPSLGLIIPSSADLDSRTADLLSHYILQLADILQPIYHPRNPFRTIHVHYAVAGPLTRVPEASVSMQGRSSSSRAILHSLISASAFHLRGYETERHMSWDMYDEIGRLNRLQALKWLQEDLVEPPKDAEALYMTMSASLTLVTADVRRRIP